MWWMKEKRCTKEEEKEEGRRKNRGRRRTRTESKGMKEKKKRGVLNAWSNEERDSSQNHSNFQKCIIIQKATLFLLEHEKT
jgi:hypothetical protein